MRVMLRERLLGASVENHAEADGTLFLALSPPPPVGSILTVTHDAGTTAKMRVVRVLELATEHRTIGCLVREHVMTGSQVGSEHLSPERRDLAVAAPVAITDEGTGIVEAASGRLPN